MCIRDRDKYYAAGGKQIKEGFVFKLILEPYQSLFVLHAPEDAVISRRIPVMGEEMTVADVYKRQHNSR